MRWFFKRDTQTHSDVACLLESGEFDRISDEVLVC
jgi:hypothetical protein